MTRKELMDEINALAQKAREANEPYIAANLVYLAGLIANNVEGTYISLLSIMNKHFKP